MKDKEIRNILIAYLKAKHDEVRIYQEKSIGSAICDIMAVTDKLIGYEIKSDGDNYQRLERQIEFYDRFFDENYIVVSRKHIASAENKVPKHWGIIYIDDNEVKVSRNAANNENVSRRSQITVLWKLELKNLLIKNNLPLYAQKEKGYISDKICQQIDMKSLGKQIAYELLHRDYSVYDAEDYTIYSKQEVFRNMPALDIIDTLSEQNFEQITLDKWIELYKSAKQIQKEKEDAYAQKEVIRLAHKITYKDIEVSLGVGGFSFVRVGNLIDVVLKSKLEYMSKFCIADKKELLLSERYFQMTKDMLLNNAVIEMQNDRIVVIENCEKPNVQKLNYYICNGYWVYYYACSADFHYFYWFKDREEAEKSYNDLKCEYFVVHKALLNTDKGILLEQRINDT